MTRNSSKMLFDELQSLITEQRNPDTEAIDTASVKDILAMINREDAKVHLAVQKELPQIEKGVHLIVNAFRNGGRLWYTGAGTSGRLGVLDASECPPTFGSDPDLVQGVIAGGYDTLIRSQEGVEDNKEAGKQDLEKRGFTGSDVLCGLTASKRTPYVLGGLEHASKLGAKTIFISCNPKSTLPFKADVTICPVVGPEVIMGSTRMKAGTAEKMVLNMLTTASFIRLGKVFKNMMVDLKMTSEKLRERSKRTVMMVTGVGYDEASELLTRADGHVKTAIVMILANVDQNAATTLLDSSEGFVKTALEKAGVNKLV